MPTAASYTKRVYGDADYAPKPDLAQESSVTPRKYAVMRSVERRDVDHLAALHGDTRHVRAVPPYALPLGPGSYLGTGMKGLPGAKPKPATKGSIRGTSSFSSPPRGPHRVMDLPDVSDTMTRDSKGWTSRGFYTSRSPREVCASAYWESGKASSPIQATGGLLRMAERSSHTPAFDTMYDSLSPGRELSRDITASPMRYSGAFRSQQMRLANLPSGRTNDSRMRTENNCMGESGRRLGPGYYGRARTMDGRSLSPGGHVFPESLAAGGSTAGRGTAGLFSSTFKGSASGRSTSMSFRGENSLPGSPVIRRAQSSLGAYR